LETVKPPWFVTVRSPEDNHVQLSEDFYFTAKLKSEGYEIWVDPAIKCEHIQRKGLLELYYSLRDEILHDLTRDKSDLHMRLARELAKQPGFIEQAYKESIDADGTDNSNIECEQLAAV
jgi:hypothetical protein